MIDQREAIRAQLATSVLGRSGGVLASPLLSPAARAALEVEAMACVAHAETYRVESHDGEEVRGGNPDRWLDSASGGLELRELYASAGVAALLTDATGVGWTPSGSEGTYSYYREPGHHLGIHRDVEDCDLALIVCVADSYAGDVGVAGTLCVYPGRAGEPLSAVRARPDHGALYVRLAPGQAALLLGGMVPHRVLPVASSQSRIVAPLCFTALT